MNITTLDNSSIIEIGKGKPVVGIVGLVHGDELCGRAALDYFKSYLTQNPPTVILNHLLVSKLNS